jgi:molybdopterin synthase sulfur carrier subunit
MVVQVDFYALVKSAFGTSSMRIDFSPPATVIQILEGICQTAQHRESIMESPGRLRKDLTVLKNGRNIQFLRGPETEIQNGDTIAVFSRVAGG